MQDILNKLQKEAIKKGFTFNEAEANKFSWIKADLIFMWST